MLYIGISTLKYRENSCLFFNHVQLRFQPRAAKVSQSILCCPHYLTTCQINFGYNYIAQFSRKRIFITVLSHFLLHTGHFLVVKWFSMVVSNHWCSYVECLMPPPPIDLFLDVKMLSWMSDILLSLTFFAGNF